MIDYLLYSEKMRTFDRFLLASHSKNIIFKVTKWSITYR